MSAGTPGKKDLRQTVFIILVLLLGGVCLLTEIPFRLPVERELHAVLWDAWGQETGETDLRIRGKLTFQLGKPIEFSGVFQVEGYEYTLEEKGSFPLLWLRRGSWSDLWEGSLHYWIPPADTYSLGHVYTDLSFRTVLIDLPNHGRWVGYAAPAETPEEARDLFWRHIPWTRGEADEGERT